MNKRDIRAMSTQEFDDRLTGLIAKIQWVMPLLNDMLDELQRHVQIERSKIPLTAEQQQFLDADVGAGRTGFSARTRNALTSWHRGKGFPAPMKIRDLTYLTPTQILAIKNLGEKSLREIEVTLSDHGLSLLTGK